MQSRRLARLSTNRPPAARLPARASSSAIRSSFGDVSGSRRSAAPNQCAALDGEPGGCLASLAEGRDRAEVALAGRALDVVGARRRCRPPSCERFGATLVGRQPPAAPGGLVDGPSDQGMPEAEPPRHVGLADEIEHQELVDGVHRRVLGCPGRGRRQLGLEGITRHRRSFEHQACALREQGQLFAQRGGDGGQDAVVGQRDVGTGGECT